MVGVVATILVEITLISPPDGSVLYVLQGLRTPSGPIAEMFAGVLPAFAAVLLLMTFPLVALYLPSLR